VLTAWMMALCLLSPALAQNGGSASPTGTPAAGATPHAGETSAPGQSLAELQQRLAEVESALRSETPPSAPDSLENPDQPPPYYTSLLRLESSLRRLLTLRETEALLKAQTERLEAETLDFTQNGLDDPGPYPITLLDSLDSQLAESSQELSTREAALASVRADAKVQEAALRSRQAQRRRLLEQNGSPGGATDLQLERDRENATWAVKAAESNAELARAEVVLAERAQTLAEKRRDLVTRKVELVKANLEFGKSLLEGQLKRLDQQRSQLNSALLTAQRNAADTLEKVKALDRAGTSDPIKAAQSAALKEWLTTYQRKKILLEQELELNLAERDVWERRFSLHQGQALAQLTDWTESTRSLLWRLTAERQALEDQLSGLRERMATVVASGSQRIDAIEHQRDLQAKAMAAHQELLEDALAKVRQASALAQHLLDELQARRSGMTLRERGRRVWELLVSFWHIELYTIGDSSVTVGKMNIAFLVLLIGLTLVGRTTRFVSGRLLTHLPLPDAVKASIERFLRYFFVLLVCLFALKVVNIPLTIFTFLGGTLAIAVGFGAQNILNNFISGLILMVERPVRVGDLVEVDQITGVIEEIGARSTRVRMAIGIHVVLPNSKLLENRVINWTLTDQRVRTSVSVGVAYGSDLELVMTLLMRAALGVETVEKTPEPFVVLEEFGESALQFTIHFWVSMAQGLTKRLTESNLRLAIAALFADNDVAIPFPQRDLNIGQPIAVRLLADEKTKETS
jgi:small-conductance mechanosensitive channel